MPDPCGPDEGYQRVLAIYAKYVINGANCTNKEDTRSKTLEGYLKAVNFLFEKRGFFPLLRILTLFRTGGHLGAILPFGGVLCM